MLKRLITFGVQRTVNGPAKSWVFTSGAMLLMRIVSGQTGRRETIDLSNTKPGDKILIEHLPITHKQQLKQFKADAKTDKKSDKAAKKAKKASNKTAKQVKKAGKVEARAAKRAARARRKATKVRRSERRRTSV